MTNKTRRNRQRANKRKGLVNNTENTVPDSHTTEMVTNETSSSGGGFRQLASNLMSRLHLANLTGMQFGGKRDLYSIFGYEKRLTPEKFYAKYIRQDITSRIIDAPPGATWSNPPTFEASDTFNNQFETLSEKHNLWNIMNRCDKLARLGHFSCFMLGFDDGNPAKKLGNVKDLLYARPISSRMVKRIVFEKDPRNPRFGLPLTYDISYDDPNNKVISAGNMTIDGVKNTTIHHSRMVHIVENPLEDTVFGIPIIEKVYNLLDDLLKVSGGTAEMYWLSARQGLQADIDKEMDLDPDDAAALSDEMDEFQHQLRRVIRTRGVNINTLDSQVHSPKDIFELLMSLISGTTGIPRRILLGSEAGQLASEQDRANWAERIDERRKLFAGPTILNPIVDALIAVKLLPDEEYKIKWPSAFRMSPLEEGQMMAQKARAIGNMSRQTGNQTPMQVLSERECREILQVEGTIPDSERFDPQRDSKIIPDNVAQDLPDAQKAADDAAEAKKEAMKDKDDGDDKDKDKEKEKGDKE